MKPTEAAKLARRDLKAAFPGVKFSLRCRNYSTFDVSWIDGPTEPNVAAILDRYDGWKTGVDDCMRPIPNRPDYAVIRYILTHRRPSADRARVIADGIQAGNAGVTFTNPDDAFNDTQIAPEQITFEGARYDRPWDHADLGMIARRIFNQTTA